MLNRIISGCAFEELRHYYENGEWLLSGVRVVGVEAEKVALPSHIRWIYPLTAPKGKDF
jgi:hypothetical protein